jgi:hypothetical protein
MPVISSNHVFASIRKSPWGVKRTLAIFILIMGTLAFSQQDGMTGTWDRVRPTGVGYLDDTQG